MSAEQQHHIVKMANQIVLNMGAAGDENEIAKHASEHMRRFWSPLMKQRAAEILQAENDALTPVAKKALTQLFE